MTEADSIRMTLIAGPNSDKSYANSLTKDFASFSADGKHFVVLLKKGNLENNTVEYSMLLFQTDEIFNSPHPRTLVTMASSSSREAISNVSWLGDNDTILFLGEHPGETAQLYSVQCSSGNMKKLSSHPTSLTAYSSDPAARTIVYVAGKPAVRVVSDRVLREGFVVGDEQMADVIAGELLDNRPELFVLKTEDGSVRPLPIPPELQDGSLEGWPEFSLSPDGRNLIAKLNLTEVPEKWRQYNGEPLLVQVLAQRVSKGSASWVFRYGIIDTETGHGRVLLDAPVGYHDPTIAWSPDGTSVLLTGVYLPLTDPDQADPSVAKGKTFVVDVDLETLKYSKVAHQNLKFVQWNRRTNVVTLEDRLSELSRDVPNRCSYQKVNGKWKEVAEDRAEGANSLPEISSGQSLNDPPTIVARNRNTAEKAVLLDLNPQFQRIHFGRVEEIKFTVPDGTEVHSGLYFPPDFLSGRQYPLVVQTHGFDPNAFWIDGSFTTAFAAQALAAKGMLVLQVPDLHKGDETPDEAPYMSGVLERAIDTVEKRGIVDRDHIGIIGFSRTGLYVHHMLTHGGTRFAAAVVADGSNAGYTSYVQFLNSGPYTAHDSESIIGGLPWGETISLWLERSPEFRLDRVHTPLLLQALSRHTVGYDWAIYAGLRRLGKPVELLYLPEGSHILQNPWERMTSEQGDVDWFCFWLKGEEDPDPGKAAQYRRWRELRNLQGRAASAASTR